MPAPIPAQDPLRVEVDDREAPGPVAEALRAIPGVEVTVQRLALGDYRVDGRLLVERKTLVDLAASLADGRLFSQACRLAAADTWVALVLEGSGADLAGCGMRREALQGALVTVTLYLGIPLLRARDSEETARLILYAARQGRAITAGAVRRPGRRIRGKRQLQLHLLQGLPGVGSRRAARLLERFGSVEAVLTADPGALSDVSGVGPRTARLIRWAVEEPAANYAPRPEDDACR